MSYILHFYVISRTVFVSVFPISSILDCSFILCIIVTNLALWLQDLNKLAYLLTYLLTYAYAGVMQCRWESRTRLSRRRSCAATRSRVRLW